ncbi:MAG: thioesterase family protein [Gammaproteobacteria bacterium]|nr:thioesterase family protein [Gammaproteobacteria bacterium]
MSEIDLRRRASFPHWTTDVIRYSDLDPNGHVNNGAINAFLEDGRVRFRDAHLKTPDEDILTGFVLVKYTIEYHAMLHFPGSVDVGTTVTRIGNSSYTLGQGVFRDGADDCVASALVVTVRVDPKTRKPTPLGESFKARLLKVSPDAER